VTDDQSPGGAPFSWGLRPAGTPPETGGAADDGGGGDKGEAGTDAEVATQAIDQGEFLALPLEREASWDDDDDGEPTAAFDFRAPPPAVSTLPTAVYHEGPALPWEQTHTPAPSPAIDSALAGSTGAIVAQPAGVDAPVDESAPTNPLDRLFGDENFHEYDDAPAHDLVKSLVPVAAPRALVPAPIVAPRPAPPRAPKPPRGRLPKSQRIGLGVAAGLVAATVLAALFFVGTRIADAPPAAQPDPSVSEAPAPPPVEEPVAQVGPVAPGLHDWHELLGTECIEPYTSAWEQEFTVVDCATPHGAQLVYRGRFDDSALDAYPGVEALQSRMNVLCASPENIDYAAAGAVSDIQLSASFPGDEEAWAAGDRGYFCFVSRSSGEPLAANVATPPRAPVAVPVVPAPEP